MDLLFGFSGRIGRARWWLAQLAVLALAGTCMGIVLALDPAQVASGKAADSPAGAILAVLALSGLIVWIAAASGVKRHRDRGRSGYWLLVALVPCIGGLWHLVECGFRRGARDVNERGGDAAARRGGALDDFDIEAVVRPGKATIGVVRPLPVGAFAAASAPGTIPGLR